MIILIGGTSCSGKTKLAYELIKKYRYPCFSLDHLKMGLIRGLDGCPISAVDEDEQNAGYLWPIVKGIIETNIENKQHLILEGCYLPCHGVKKLIEAYPHDILAIYMVFSENYLRTHFEDVLGYRCVVEARGYEEERTVEMLVAEHQLVLTSCKLNNLPYFLADNSYDEMFGEILKFICDKIGF